MTTPHIIEYEGREYDLTKLEMPLGLLRDTAYPVYDALIDWDHGREWWNSSDGRWSTADEFPLFSDTVYRAKPAPKKPVIETRFGVCYAKVLDQPHFNQHNFVAAMQLGNWTATMEDGKPVHIVWEASK